MYVHAPDCLISAFYVFYWLSIMFPDNFHKHNWDFQKDDKQN